jgi:hypothetical protein
MPRLVHLCLLLEVLYILQLMVLTKNAIVWPAPTSDNYWRSQRSENVSAKNEPPALRPA